MTWSQVSGYISAFIITQDLPTNLPPPEVESHVRPLLQFNGRSDKRVLFRQVWRRAHDIAEELGIELGQRIVVQACSEVARQPFRLDVDNSSPFLSQTSDKWHSSEFYLGLVRAVLTHISCDPCTDVVAQRFIQATIFYTYENSGLLPGNQWGSVDAPSTVHLNCPGGVSSDFTLFPDSNIKCFSLQGRFLIRAMEEVRLGNVSEVVAHIKAAIGYQWFHRLAFKFPLCFLAKRIEFDNPDRDTCGMSPHGSAVIYMGPNIDKFVTIFGAHGQIVLPTTNSNISNAPPVHQEAPVEAPVAWGGHGRRRTRAQRACPPPLSELFESGV